MRGTIFKRFWDRGRAATDPTGDDIADIHTWNARLGEHFPAGDLDRASNLVVVIRSDIVRKFEMPLLVLNEATGTTWQSGSGVDHEPSFFGKVARDIAFYEFDVSRERIVTQARDRAFLVIYEPSGRLRFGLDVATAAVRQQRQDVGKQSLAFPVRMLGRTEARVLVRKDPPLPPPASPAKWDDFSWRHVNLSSAGYINFATSFTIPGQPDLWGAGKNAATIARSFWQRPLAAVLPLRRVL